MSTDARSTRRGARHGRRRRGFVVGLTLVVTALATIGLVGAALAGSQGPRATSVDVDPAAAAEASGARLIVTTSQSLADVDAAQVSVEPAVPFEVDTSGRSVGIRFGLPLWDDTEYTVRIGGLHAVGGGPTAVIEESFRTPPASVYLLQRGDEGDAIVRSGIAGADPVVVFRDDHIEDFRRTAEHLVVSVRTGDDEPRLIMTDLAGGGAVDLPLPGDGYVSNLQSADRGELVGYTYSDRDLGSGTGRESTLFISSLREPTAEPTLVAPDGVDARAIDWRFVPDTDRFLLLSFDGSLLLTDAESAAPTALGSAMAIEGIARGTATAVVLRADGMTAIDLRDGTESALVASDDDLGLVADVVPLAGGATLRSAASVVDGEFTGSTVISFVAADGATHTLAEVPEGDAAMGMCVSPSQRYLALQVAPDAVDNPYDGYLLPLPERVETRVIALADGSEVSTLDGAEISWCQVPQS